MIKILNAKEQVTEIPYMEAAKAYADYYSSMFVTPAHIMLPLLDNFGVHGLIKKTGMPNIWIYQLEKFLVDYIKASAYAPRDITKNIQARAGYEYSIDTLNFSRLFWSRYSSTKDEVTFSSYMYAFIYTMSDSKELFQNLTLTATSFLKRLKDIEKQEPVFNFSVEDKVNVPVNSNRGFIFDSLNQFNIVTNATNVYTGIQQAYNAGKEVSVYTSKERDTVLGYAGIDNILTALKKENEETDFMAKLASLSTVGKEPITNSVSVSNNTVNSISASQKEASAGTPVSSQVAKEPLVMYGNEQALAITKDVLVRADKPYLLIIGDSGVGKTHFVHYVEQEINNNTFGTKETTFMPYELDILELNSHSKFKGEFEKTVADKLAAAVSKATKQNKKLLLIIEDLHRAVADGVSSGDVPELYTLLLSAMTKYDFSIIGTTSYEEYRSTIAKKPRFNNILTQVTLEEPKKEDTLKILSKEGERLIKHYNLNYDTDVLSRIYDLAAQHIRDKKFPAKGINILNQIYAHAYISADETVSMKSLAEIMERDYKVPSAMLKDDLQGSLTSIRDTVRTNVIGQDEAIDMLMRYWKIKQYGLSRENKPIASLLFVGPTGVGKTELAKQFADAIGYKLIRFDMSEYKEAHTVSKLIGSPAGYVGHEEGGLLVNQVKSNPNCVLLLDEIEKAHNDIYNLLLQIMDNAEITSSLGEKVDFQNAILLMTSNCGAKDAEHARGLGFGMDGSSLSKIQSEVMQRAITNQFTPEFRGRLNAIIQFNPMTKDMCERITEHKLDNLNTRVMKTRKNFSLTFQPDLVKYIVEKAMRENSGGRSVDKSLDEVTDKLLDMTKLDDLDVVMTYTDKIELQETYR